MPIRILLPKLQRISSLGKYPIGKWKNKNSIYNRLPDFYKKMQIDFLNRTPQPVHFKPNPKKYEVDHETGEVKRVQNLSPVILRPAQSKLGLWGGEGVIPGYKRPDQRGYSRPQYLSTKLWRPHIKKLLFYSEILNKYYALTCTRRTLDLIEQAQGFDSYILKTHEADLCSDFGMQLKREMLIKLAKKDSELWPDDPKKRDMVYNRYKEHEIPLEHAEWVGLKPFEAIKKQRKIEEEQSKAQEKPFKEIYTQQLLEKLEKLALEGKDVTIQLAPKEKPPSITKRVIEEWTGKR